MILRAKNWNKFQHYKDRSPGWIKLYRELLDDRIFHRLPDASRALAPMLWLLASESSDGSIPDCIAEISFRLRMTEKKVEDALQPLVDAGFFSLEQDASAPLADGYQDACLESESESESEKRKRERERERESPRGRGNRLPNDWSPSDEDKAFAEKHGLNPLIIGASFKDYWIARADAGARKADWAAAWRAWIRREAERRGTGPPQTTKPAPWNG